MKRFFTLLNFFMLPSISVQAHALTGFWKGYFIHNTYYGREYYDEEVQLLQSSQATVSGISYSYTDYIFYGKSSVTGLYKPKSNVLIFRATKFIHTYRVACLITYYLHYRKNGKLETLTGTYTTINPMNNSVCGRGEVYLSKTSVSNFYKERSLVDREKDERIKQKVLAEKKIELSFQNVPDNASLKNKPDKTSVIKSDTENNKTKVLSDKVINPPAFATSFEDKTFKTVKSWEKVTAPDAIRNRGSKIAKTFSISAPEIKIELYDNGIVDGDTISVYDNNQLIVSKKGLTGKPISFTLKADTSLVVHEFAMVAENLGSIPPNTALMVITAGSKRYEVFLTSTKQKNAVVIIEYKPGEKK